MKTGLMSYTQTRMNTGRTGDIQGEASGLLSFYSSGVRTFYF